MMANRNKGREDRGGKPYFNEDLARRAAGRLFEEAEGGGGVPTYAEYAAGEAEAEPKPHPARKPDPEDVLREEEAHEDYINTTIRSTREIESRMLRGEGTRYKDFVNDKPDPAPPRPASPRSAPASGKPFGAFSEVAVVFAVTVALFAVVCAFLIFKINAVNKQLKEKDVEITAYLAHETEYQSLVIEADDLRTKNADLQNIIDARDDEIADLRAAAQQEPAGETAQNPPAAENPPSQTQQNASGQTVHTVARGETLWRIAEKYYNDGSQYTKILTANGLKEADAGKIYEGMKLVIPAN